MKKITKIYSIHCNRPDFIRMQHDSFCHWMKSPYELIIVNNADDIEAKNNITYEAQRFGLKVLYTKSPRNIPGFKHADSMNQVWQHICRNEQEHYVMIIDGDVFAIGEFSTEKYLEGAVMAGVKQQREYLWHWLSPVVMVFDLCKMPNPETIDWEGGAAPNGTRMDTGGNLYYYFVQHPEIKENVKWMYHTWHINSQNKNLHVLPDNLLGYQEHWSFEIYGDVFLHYCRSSNWDGQNIEYHLAKTKFTSLFVYGCISGKIKAKKLNYKISNDEYFGWGKWL